MIDRTFLNYYGGKFNLAPWVLEHFPPHDVYVEVFGGALSVFMQKPRCRVEVVNDIDSRIVNLYRCLREGADHLKVLLELTPYSRAEYQADKTSSPDPLEDARRMISSSFMGIGNSLVDGNTNGFRNSKLSATSPSASWRNYVAKFEKFHDRIFGALIENLSWEDCIAKYDDAGTLFYLDPPYVAETRTKQHRNFGYRFEMSNDDHARLIECVQGIKGMVVLSGYDNPIYSSLNWQRFETESQTQGNSFHTEVLWINPAAVKAQAQGRLF